MSRRTWIGTVALVAFLVGSWATSVWADSPPTAKEIAVSTGTLKAPSPETTRSQAFQPLPLMGNAAIGDSAMAD